MTEQTPAKTERKPDEGYIYCSYGPEKYLRHVVASLTTIRRYDTRRPAVLYCSAEHREILEQRNLCHHFYQVKLIDEEHQSIVGFKHNLHRFMPFHRNLYLDSDIVWCKDPDPLWIAFLPYKYTITGNETADLFFGGPKGIGIVADYLLFRRRRTLKRFGLTYLSRVQSGMIYCADRDLASDVSERAKVFLSKSHLTHFRSRIGEKGRTHESCEWSLAMAMSEMGIRVFPWLAGEDSPQLDFLENYTQYSESFHSVRCLLYADRFTYDLKAVRPDWLRRLMLRISTLRPGKGDHMYVTPYCLHFGWLHQKEPFYRFADQTWYELTQTRPKSARSEISIPL